MPVKFCEFEVVPMLSFQTYKRKMHKAVCSERVVVPNSSKITYFFPPPQNHYLLQTRFRSYYRKILSQISSLVTLTRPSFSIAYECYDRGAEREKDKQQSVYQN